MDNGDGRTEHIWILMLSVAAIVGAFALQPAPDGLLVLPLDLLGVRLEIPQTCMSRRILGVSCPGCGLTRSFVLMARGEWQQAVSANRMGPIIFLLCWLQIPYRMARYLGWDIGCRNHPIVEIATALVAWGILAGLIVTWVIELMGR